MTASNFKVGDIVEAPVDHKGNMRVAIVLSERKAWCDSDMDMDMDYYDVLVGTEKMSLDFSRTTEELIGVWSFNECVYIYEPFLFDSKSVTISKV